VVVASQPVTVQNLCPTSAVTTTAVPTATPLWSATSSRPPRCTPLQAPPHWVVTRPLSNLGQLALLYAQQLTQQHHQVCVCIQISFENNNYCEEKMIDCQEYLANYGSTIPIL